MELFKDSVDGTVANPVDAELRRLNDMKINTHVSDPSDYGDEEVKRLAAMDMGQRKYFSGA